MKRAYVCLMIVLAFVVCACAPNQGGNQSGAPDAGASAASSAVASKEISHRYASASEGKDLLLSNDRYYAGFSQNDLDFRMQRKGATLEEYKSFASEQTRDFTQEERDLVDKHLKNMEAVLGERGYTLPPLDEVTFVKTTMAEERGAGAYTHGTTIYLSDELLNPTSSEDNSDGNQDYLIFVFWHELFHCLTRCNPGFRADMYKLIHFSVHDADYTLPPRVKDYHISNPDVENHNSSATFTIDGKDVECFVDWVTTRHFEEEGDDFFDLTITALVPVDGTDTYYTPEQTTNFYEVFGRNTQYVTDPEECMADNFAFAMLYGTAGPEGNGYESPEIIEGIIDYLSR